MLNYTYILIHKHKWIIFSIINNVYIISVLGCKQTRFKFQFLK